VTGRPARIEIGELRISGLARPVALRAAAAFERELARLAEAGTPDQRMRTPIGAPLRVGWSDNPERLGRAMAEAVHVRIAT
jgi:hypothetical protein